MKPHKWDQKVRDERERNKEKKAEMRARLTGVPLPEKGVPLPEKPIPSSPAIQCVTYSFTEFGGTLAFMTSVLVALAELVPAVSFHYDNCPDCEGTGLALSNLIMHLNDQHKWSRERIADWLDTLDVDLTLQPKGNSNVTATPPKTKVTITPVGSGVYFPTLVFVN